MEDDNTGSSYRSPENGSSFVRFFQTHLVMFLCLCGTEEKQRKVKRRISRAKKQGLWSLLIWWSCDGAIQNSSRCSRTFFPSIWPFTAQPELLLRAQMATSLVHQRIISVSSDASQALYESQPNCQWTPYADFSNLDNVAVVPLFVQKPNNKETNRLVFFSPPWLASEMVV